MDISPWWADHGWTTGVDDGGDHAGEVVQEGADGGEEQVVEGDQEGLEQVVGGRAEQAASHHLQHLVHCDDGCHETCSPVQGRRGGGQGVV